MMLIRLNKHLADLGHASRRGAEKLIESGAVKVNGKVVNELGSKIDPDSDQIKVTAPSLPAIGGYMLNKPVGYVTTKSEGEGKNILELLPTQAAAMSHAGRLDKESRGLVLMLADGRLSYALTAPDTHQDKEYQVRVEPEATGSQIEKMRTGLNIDGNPTKPAKVEGSRSGGPRAYQSLLTFTLTEGRKHQIRKMCKKVGLKVIDLKRIRVGSLKMGGLEEGKWRPIKQREIDQLQKSLK